MPSREGLLFQETYPAGTLVRLSEKYLAKLPEKERKRYVGREGLIRGYRLQNDPKPRPIVLFPKFGRFKEEAFYEMPWTDIELVDLGETDRGNHHGTRKNRCNHRHPRS